MDTKKPRLLHGQDRDRLLRDLVEDLGVVKARAVNLRAWLAALNTWSAKPRLSRQVEAAACRLEEAADHIEAAIKDASLDASIEILVFLLRRFYADDANRKVSSPDAFERTLDAVLVGARLPPSNTVLRAGKLTKEEDAALRACARARARSLGRRVAVTAKAGVIADALVALGLPDIRTVGGKARVDVYPAPATRDATALVVAARIAGVTARRVLQVEKETTLRIDDHGDLFTVVASWELLPSP